jgi:hypothetical protein
MALPCLSNAVYQILWQFILADNREDIVRFIHQR